MKIRNRLAHAEAVEAAPSRVTMRGPEIENAEPWTVELDAELIEQLKRRAGQMGLEKVETLLTAYLQQGLNQPTFMPQTTSRTSLS